MPIFELLKRKDVNPTSLTSLDAALSSIKKEHDTNITTYNKLFTELHNLPVDESKKPYINELIGKLEENINQVTDGRMYHNAGDTLTKFATQIATDEHLQQAVKSKAEYDSYLKELDKMNIPEGMKQMYREKNTYSAGIDYNTGKWSPVSRPTGHVDIGVIEKTVEEDLIKAMVGYGTLYYRTPDGNFTTDKTVASSSQPYYMDGQTPTPIDVGKVRNNMIQNIYRNPTYLNSLKQEYEYYKYLYTTGELVEKNPVYNNNGKTELTFDQFVEKSVNGFYNNQSLDIYYSNRYVNPAVVNGSKPSKTVIVKDNEGKPIHKLTKEEIEAAQEEQAFQKQIEKNKNAVTIQDDKPYNANNTKNLFDGFKASGGHLQNMLDIINQKLPQEQQLQIDGKSYSDIEKFVTTYYESNDTEIPFEVVNALDKYKHSLQLTENILNNISKKSGVGYYDIALRYYIDNGINLLPNDDRFIEYINLYDSSKYYGEEHEVKNYNAATQYQYHPQFGIPIGKHIPTTYKTGYTQYDFVIDGEYYNIGDEKYDIFKYLEDDLDTPIKSISNIDLYRNYAGATSDNTNEIDIERRVKTSLNREASAISLLGRNGANFDVYIGDKLSASNKNDVDGVKRNAVGSLISYIYDNFEDFINISYDATNLNAIISIRRPSFKSYINVDDKKIIEAAEGTINGYLEKAGLSHIGEGENITIVVPNFMDSGLKDEHLNNPLIQSTQEITQLLYSNLYEYTFDEDIRKAKVTFDKHIVDGKVRKGDLEQTLFDAGGTKVNITRDEMINYRNAEKSFIYLKNKYKDIEDDYNLSKEEALNIILALRPLYPDIDKDITINENSKHELVVNEICALLGSINPNLVNKFKSIVYANK